jgi:DNA-binding PadR family transcriptional regulator
MTGFINKRLFQGFICLHILHHANQDPVYGSWMIEELSEHGYKLSPGTLYPILHNLEKEGLMEHYDENVAVNPQILCYYRTRQEELVEAKKYLAELVDEIEIVKEDGNV